MKSSQVNNDLDIGALLMCAGFTLLTITACVMPQTPNTECPPLPVLKEGATRSEGRLWTLTVVALYEQCAKSKGKNP